MGRVKRACRSGDRSQAGGVMIVVLVVVLTVSSLGLFAAHTTTYEIRASGHQRVASQAQYIGESGLVASHALMDSPAWGPRGLLYSVEQTVASGTLTLPTLAPFEPNLLAGKTAYRLYSEDFVAFTAAPPVAAEGLGAGTGGARQPYDPLFTVDIYDHYTWTGTLAGQRSDGYGRLQFLHATYTSRGRMILRDGDTTATASFDGPRRQYHEAANNARAYGISGPYAP